jgi:peptidoglycan/xylan/chitin deacetylase (PgdA/CDA1 family)
VAPIRVALTFDAEHADRPSASGTERLLVVLAAAATRATFFLQGRWVESVPSMARALVDAHHVIGSHGHYHGRMSHLTDEGIADDVRRAEEAIRQACGVDPRPWFRCPFGDGASDPRVLGAITAAGYRHVGWHVDGEDWADDATAEGVEVAVRDGVRGVGDGAVVLLHGWPAVTPTVVERLLARAADDGVVYVGINELGETPVETVPW